MRVREELELLGSTKVFNIYTLSENSLKPYMYDKKEIDYLKVMIKAYSRDKSFGDISKFLDSTLFINYVDYPLPGFTTKKDKPVVNLGILNIEYLTDFQAADVYSCFLYSLLFSNYVKHKPFKIDLLDQIVLFIFNTIMMKYGKSSGLTGSFSELVPRLRFLVYLYVYDGLFGKRIDSSFIRTTSTKLMTSYDEIKTKYDFSKFSELLKAINDNHIISISENVFAKDFVEIGGIVCIPMFEDLSRMFATLLASTVSGNNVFSSYWKKKSKEIFEKMIFFGTRNIKN